MRDTGAEIARLAGARKLLEAVPGFPTEPKNQFQFWVGLMFLPLIEAAGLKQRPFSELGLVLFLAILILYSLRHTRRIIPGPNPLRQDPLFLRVATYTRQFHLVFVALLLASLIFSGPTRFEALAFLWFGLCYLLSAFLGKEGFLLLAYINFTTSALLLYLLDTHVGMGWSPMTPAAKHVRPAAAFLNAAILFFLMREERETEKETGAPIPKRP